MMTGANAPQSTPDDPSAATVPPPPRAQCQDNAVLGLQFDQRLWLLRERELEAGRKVQGLVVLSACFLVVVTCANIIIAFNTFGPFDLAELADLLLHAGEHLPAVLGILAACAVLVYIIAACLGIAAVSHKLFRYHYIAAWREMQFGEQALVFVDEDRLGILQAKLNKLSMLQLQTRPGRRTLARQLQFCACHMRSLSALQQRAEAKLYIQQLNLDQLVYNSQGLIEFAAKVHWLLALLLFLLLANITIALAVFFTVVGPRYIISRAALVAFLDYLLDQPLYPVDGLQPPGGKQLGWWEQFQDILHSK